MEVFAVDLDQLRQLLQQRLSDKAVQINLALQELTLEVKAADYLEIVQRLQLEPGLQFELLVDLCAVDYSSYKDLPWEGSRFCVVLHLLSISLNQRLRLKVFCQDDVYPQLPSVNHIWAAANWFEREAFDLFGIIFEGHNDLRRILTDYGFIGHPFRKDFPISGYVEMIYDEVEKRVIYQPVSIDVREITPRIIREENYAGL